MSFNSYKKLIIANMAGTLLEVYDMSIYPYFASIIAKNFFPSDDPGLALLNTFAIFMVSFIVRPIGAILFGHLGDTIGRKPTLMITIGLITVGTCGIGLLPTTAQIGVLGPILLILMRMTQGLSYAGEYVGALVFLLEQAPPNHKTLTASFATCGGNMGLLIASLLCWLLTYIFTPEVLTTWGWRIPFLLAALGGIVTLFLRRTIDETLPFDAHNRLKTPLKEVITQQKTALLTILGVTGFYMVICYSIYIWSTTCFTLLGHFSMQAALAINSLAIFLQVALIPLIALWADSIGRKGFMQFGIISLIVLVYPYYYCVSTGNLYLVLMAHLILTLVATTFSALLPVTIAEAMPAKMRYSGISLGYNLAGLLVGGTTPLIAMMLLRTAYGPLLLSIYFIFWALVAFIGIQHLPFQDMKQPALSPLTV